MAPIESALPYLIPVLVVASVVAWQMARAGHLTFREAVEATAILTFLLVRGLLLWLVIPAAILLWLVLSQRGRSCDGAISLPGGSLAGWT